MTLKCGMKKSTRSRTNGDRFTKAVSIMAGTLVLHTALTCGTPVKAVCCDYTPVIHHNISVSNASRSYVYQDNFYFECENTPVIVEVFTPDDEDVDALCKMAWGEARGCGEKGIEAVMWVAMNRLDTGRWGDSVLSVVSAPSQFYGYSKNNPVTDDIRAIAEKVLTDYYFDAERLIPSDYIYFHGDGRENIFRNERGEKVRV